MSSCEVLCLVLTPLVLLICVLVAVFNAPGARFLLRLAAIFNTLEALEGPETLRNALKLAVSGLMGMPRSGLVAILKGE